MIKKPKLEQRRQSVTVISVIPAALAKPLSHYSSWKVGPCCLRINSIHNNYMLWLCALKRSLRLRRFFAKTQHRTLVLSLLLFVDMIDARGRFCWY